MDFYLSGRVSLGNYVYNNNFANANYSNLYFPPVISTTFQGHQRHPLSTLQSFSDYYVQNASFFKMDNVSLGYNVNSCLQRN